MERLGLAPPARDLLTQRHDRTAAYRWSAQQVGTHRTITPLGTAIRAPIRTSNWAIPGRPFVDAAGGSSGTTETRSRSTAPIGCRGSFALRFGQHGAAGRRQACCGERLLRPWLGMEPLVGEPPVQILVAAVARRRWVLRLAFGTVRRAIRRREESLGRWCLTRLDQCRSWNSAPECWKSLAGIKSQIKGLRAKDRPKDHAG